MALLLRSRLNPDPYRPHGIPWQTRFADEQSLSGVNFGKGKMGPAHPSSRSMQSRSMLNPNPVRPLGVPSGSTSKKTYNRTKGSDYFDFKTGGFDLKFGGEASGIGPRQKQIGPRQKQSGLESFDYKGGRNIFAPGKGVKSNAPSGTPVPSSALTGTREDAQRQAFQGLALQGLAPKDSPIGIQEASAAVNVSPDRTLMDALKDNPMKALNVYSSIFQGASALYMAYATSRQSEASINAMRVQRARVESYGQSLVAKLGADETRTRGQQKAYFAGRGVNIAYGSAARALQETRTTAVSNMLTMQESIRNQAMGIENDIINERFSGRIDTSQLVSQGLGSLVSGALTANAVYEADKIKQKTESFKLSREGTTGRNARAGSQGGQ